MDISEQLQRAFDSAVTGDVEPLVSLMDSDMEWRGITSGRLWWKRTPSWHGPEEARAVLQHRVSGNKITVVEPSAEVVAATADRVIVRLRWRESERSELRSLYQILTFRDGRILDMEDVRTEGEARRATGLR